MKTYGIFKGDVLYYGALNTTRAIVESELNVVRKYMGHRADDLVIREVESIIQPIANEVNKYVLDSETHFDKST